METLRTTVGLPGLFLACLFSAALRFATLTFVWPYSNFFYIYENSTISSGLNSLAAVFLEDVIKGFFTKNLSDERAAKWSKILCKTLMK